ESVRVFALGPPCDEDALSDLNPQGDEQFHLAAGMRSSVSYFAEEALSANTTQDALDQPPFSRRYAVLLDKAQDDPEFGHFFKDYSRDSGASPNPTSTSSTSSTEKLVPNNADWRRIDKEWLYSPEQLALAMNGATNNASLVLAFELGRDGKVL